MEFNSDFSHDLVIGKVAEKKLANILENQKIEVKNDLMTRKTGNVFIEYKSRGKLSGIAKTKAKWYAICINDAQIVLIGVSTLRTKCKKYLKTARDVSGGDNNTSRGILLPINDLLR